MRRLMLLAALGLAACGDKDSTSDDSTPADDSDPTTDDSGGGDDSGGDDTGAPVTTAAGNIDLRDGTATGTVAIAKAFSFWSENLTFIYASSNPDATCDTLSELLDPRGDDVDKDLLFLSGHCNLTFSYIGEPPLETFDIQTMTGAITNAQCAYGEGTWEYDAGASFPDYYYTGEYYESAAWKGTFDIGFLDDSHEALLLNVSLDEWEGTFPYSASREGEYKASGDVDGVIVTEHCEGIEVTGWF